MINILFSAQLKWLMSNDKKVVAGIINVKY
jgi:hypothetical protein